MSYRFVGIHHVQLAAPEGCESEARQFFGDMLGFQEIEKPKSLQPRGGVWFLCGNHEVHIGVQQHFIPARKAHLAFEVRGLNQLRTNLINQGVAIIDDEIRLEEGYQRFFLNDPFGNRMEFLEQIGLNSEGADAK
ncbi:glyoxalase [Paenibacillus sp. GSMTC-2017]|uniref:VOC family protein n=1 Tax=Paenibacillus sp. GSMTC-2017 TaxID=2794350 RepID=UPI0018D9ECB6|nr:VOC family protein [Paenibacillus sp. GSMTC-2017]MBH5317111.1 glyoxalase [Paenibacillus sp. GSMTC-2017]